MKNHAPGGRIEYRDEYVFSDDREIWRRTSATFDVIHQLFESPTCSLDGEYTAGNTATTDWRSRTIGTSYSEEDLNAIDVKVSLDYERVIASPSREMCDLTIVHSLSVDGVIDPHLRGELVECYMLEFYEGGSAIAQVKRSSNITQTREFTGVFDMTPYDFDELDSLLAILRSSQSADEAETAILHYS